MTGLQERVWHAAGNTMQRPNLRRFFALYQSGFQLSANKTRATVSTNEID